MSSAVTMELLDDVLSFYRNRYREDINQLAQQYPNDRQSLYISWGELHRSMPDLATDYLQAPKEFHDLLEEALAEFDTVIDIDLSGANVRITDLPEPHTYTVGEISPSNMHGEFIAVTGRVPKVTEKKPDAKVAVFECDRCGTDTRIVQTGSGIQEPYECQGCERQGPFTIDTDASEYEDVQYLKLEEPPEEAAKGDGASIEVTVRDDLTDEVTGGDRVTVTGRLVMTREDDGFDVYLEASSVTVDQTDFEDLDIDSEDEERIQAIANGEEGHPVEALADSIAPSVLGYDTMKKALVLQLVSGVRVFTPSGSLKRGVTHVLILGDPGTAKSTLLSRVHKLSPRSAYASGKGASKAGMTAAAVADDFGDNKWTLDAGALVVANNGVACVDEIDKVPDDVVSSMHTALAQTKIHVNKAGINSELETKTSLLAAGNPKYGRFDPYGDIMEQLNLSPTLLSRFDLIFLLQDQPEEEQDRKTASHIVSDKELAKKADDPETELSEDEADKIEPAISTDTFRKYVATARSLDPKIEDPEVQETLEDRFVTLRGANGYDPEDPVPVTWRKLEGTQRLAEASARARLSETIEMEDVERAQHLIGESMQQFGVDEDKQLDADIVETGASKTQHERMVTIESIIEELQDEYDEGVPIETVVERAEEQGFDETRVEEAIESLKRDGEAYEPRTDHVRSV